MTYYVLDLSAKSIGPMQKRDLRIQQLTAECEHCEKDFDVSVMRSGLCPACNAASDAICAYCGEEPCEEGCDRCKGKCTACEKLFDRAELYRKGAGAQYCPDCIAKGYDRGAA